MDYDPIKDIFAKIIGTNKFLRITFYKLLDLLFLRSWYIRKELKRILSQKNVDNLEIYDAGTGFGQYTYFISKNFKEAKIYSADIKKDYINDCKTFFQKLGIKNVSFAVEDLKTIKHKNRFDLILSVDVMEHIDDDVTVLKNFYNALKNDGILLINSPSIYGGSDVHNENDESFIGEHFRAGYSKEELFDKLNLVGFNNFSGFYTYGFWGNLAWRLAIKYPISMINFSKLFFILLPFYYLIVLPFALFFMWLDTKSKISKGSGIIVLAQK